MDNALEIGKNSTTGSFRLFIGKVLSTVILAFGTIIMGIFIPEDAYGLYVIALIPATTILLFQDWGIGSAMTKYCAQLRATNNTGELRRIIIAGMTFEFATGLTLTVLSLLMANFVASAIFGKPESAFLMTIISVTVISTGLLGASNSIFLGFERMGLFSASMICQAIAQGLLMPLLVYFGYGALGASVGYSLSLIAASGFSLSMIYFAIFRKLPASNAPESTMMQTLKPLLAYGIPLAVGSIVGGLLPQFYSFIMASIVDTATIGNYRIALNFTVLLTFLTIPITTVLFPVFSKVDARKEPSLLETVFTSSVKYAALFLVPATIAMIVLSKPIISTIYGDKWLSAPSFLAFYVVSNLFVIFGNLSLGSLLTGLGETKMIMKLNILALFVGFPLGFLLIPQFGIFGVIAATLAAGIPSMFIGLYWTRKHYGTKADLRISARILIASAFAGATTYLVLSLLNTASWILLLIGCAVFLLIYLAAASLLGAVNQIDVNNLRTMFSSIGKTSRLLEIPLTLVEAALKMRDSLLNRLR